MKFQSVTQLPPQVTQNPFFLLLPSNTFSVIRPMTDSIPTQFVTQHLTVGMVVKEAESVQHKRSSGGVEA